jgi:hypothetical protein
MPSKYAAFQPKNQAKNDKRFAAFCAEIRATSPLERARIIQFVAALTPAELAAMPQIPAWQRRIFDAISNELDANLRRSLPGVFTLYPGCAR